MSKATCQPIRKDRYPKALIDAIRDGRRILLCSHVSPDGDTIGSLLAMRLMLLAMGKEVACICADPVPEMLHYLEGVEKVGLPAAVEGMDFDLAIAVDVSDMHRLGACQEPFFRAPRTLQIDHHSTNPGFAEINYVDGDASATGELIYDLVHALEIPVTPAIALCLFTGISTDTGNFSFDNTTPAAFCAAGELRKVGIPLAQVNRVLFRERVKAQVLLLARALDTLTFYNDDCIAGMWLTTADLEAVDARPEHAEAIVNYGIDTKGVKMAFLAKEGPEGVKFSLRAVAPYDVAHIAAGFGGGGHALAAGCTLEGPVDRAMAEVTSAMEAHLHQLQEGPEK